MKRGERDLSDEGTGHSPSYTYTFNRYLRDRFGERVQRLSLNARFTCPNRDGKISRGGCIYCNDEAFSPYAAGNLDLDGQIRQSMDFARSRYKAKKFIAYFQNATNTYASVPKLKKTYDIIRHFPDIVGLYISTRPDCVDEERLNLIRSYTEEYDVWIEYGLQSAHERTLNFINRGHTYHDFVKAVSMTAERGINVGAHVILGLPGETKEDILKTADKISKLPVSGIKFHVLHVLKDTKLAEYHEKGEIRLLAMEEYVDILCDFIERLDPGCVIFRLVSDAKEECLIGPKWINKKSLVLSSIDEEFKRRDSRQGKRYRGKGQ